MKASVSASAIALSLIASAASAQQSAARELQVLFELCVAHGIIQRQEYLERLQRDDGA